MVELSAPTRIRTLAFVSDASDAGRSGANNTRTHRPILSIYQSQTTFRNFRQTTTDKYLEVGSIYEVEYFNLPQQARLTPFYFMPLNLKETGNEEHELPVHRGVYVSSLLPTPLNPQSLTLPFEGKPDPNKFCLTVALSLKVYASHLTKLASDSQAVEKLIHLGIPSNDNIDRHSEKAWQFTYALPSTQKFIAFQAVWRKDSLIHIFKYV